MNQPALTLYHFPGACSQVSLCALEQAGLAYELELVNLASNAQSEPGYKAISPLGKVPTLVIDGDPLTENAAILTYIAALRPEAGLFPTDPSPRVRADIAGGLSFCGGTLHPTIRGIANPSRMTTGDGAPVRSISPAPARGWWLDEPSIVDVYLNWALSVARNAGFDVSELPLLATLRDRLMERPAFARMQEIEAESRTKLGL
jgi:glutathione S-transferase